MTADELLKLHETLDAVRDLIEASPDMHEPSAKGFLADMDWDAMHHAARVAHRLYMWRRFPTLGADESYLPPLPVIEPASISVDVLQRRADDIYAADRAQDANES